jgi:uncharacterized protein (DUF2235 family)
VRLYAFDGTWNSNQIDDATDTNVRRFYEAFIGADGVDRRYTQGVGTKFGIVGKIIGGVTGAGGWGRVAEARHHLERRWRGEPVVVVGFSRGAALALDFCNEIASGVDAAHVAAAGGRKPVPAVRFLGLWDVVASFGIPGNKINLGYQLTVPASVEHCCHAMALDEKRYTFALTRVKYAEDHAKADDDTRAHEVWFRGGHSDIGGGNRNVVRSNIALRWMMLHALALGVPLNTSAIPAAATEGTPLPVLAKQWLVPWRRKPAVGDRVHVSVEWSRNRGFVDPPAPFEPEVDPIFV